MFIRKFAGFAVAGLLLAAGAAQANPGFPSAAQEGSEYSVNAPLPAQTAGLTGASQSFPSAAIEGSERAERVAVQSTPRNLERSVAEGRTSAFPNSAME